MTTPALYFEDLGDGFNILTAARTLTETDVVSFAMFSGDWNQIHADDEYAATTSFGRRLVHGAAVFAAMGGLLYATGLFARTTQAVLGFEKLTFPAPVFIGDTIRCSVTVLDTRLTSSGRGLVRREHIVTNQHNATVLSCTSSILIARKETKHEF